ncbi:MAG: maleylacetate reductase [Rhodospirillaceae bacterium]|jgi:alcohol dehydrogenase class IV|nr:maleylacetate reductase [Rhodospirillaceae bacterium]
MQAFTHDSAPGRVVLGAGAIAKLPREVERLGGSRVLVIATPGRADQAESATATLGAMRVGLHAKARMHVPIETAIEGRAEARRLDADCLVTVGGGSAIGLGKGVAIELGVPLLCIVTTYSGSEMTDACGMLDGGRKVMHSSPNMRPKTVIYDPELTVGLPPSISGPSGMNAMAHCVSAICSITPTPMKTLIALEGIRAMADALPRIAKNPADIDARGDALYGAWNCGIAAGLGARGIQHKLAHVVGGTFDLPHAETHTIMLPYSAAYNAAAVPDAMTTIAKALGGAEGAEAPGALFDLARGIGAPAGLKDIGMPETGLDQAADEMMENQYANAAPYDRDRIRTLLDDAFAGRRP